MRRRRLGVAARLVVGFVLLTGVLFAGVFPSRTYLAQREAIETTQERVELLRRENDRLRGEIRRLESGEEIERLAREQYNLAKPGEEVFIIVADDAAAFRQEDGPADALAFLAGLWGVPRASLH